MAISVFDIFKIGVGPSSSHTMGPMQAAAEFAGRLRKKGHLETSARVEVRLFGSLALTGRGHCTDSAVIVGLTGVEPRHVDPDAMVTTLERVARAQRLALAGSHDIEFVAGRDIVFLMTESLPAHPNGMRFTAFDADGSPLLCDEYCSLGGGFISRGGGEDDAHPADHVEIEVPYPFRSADQLLEICAARGLRVDELVLANESAWRSEADTRARLDEIWAAMQRCVERGARTRGVLPGSLKVPRRAPAMFADLRVGDPMSAVTMIDWVDAWALAVNEENAAGGRVVTAPTNGAAGIVPAVMHYYRKFEESADIAGIHRFLLSAAAIGMLYKLNASISGAEMGCQGEVGVACSMAAGGLVAATGGSNDVLENAAEIGMEHNLGLTCDPIGGLVQIPCIERNAMGAVKAINAARIATRGGGQHKVSLDQVIETMRQTGNDMANIYKETSQGGLAVNVIEC